MDVDKYLTHSNVPWLVKKMILKIKPKMTIELTDATFKSSMTGGPKTKVRATFILSLSLVYAYTHFNST